ncbi:MAG: carboxypeptidase-like regulatory domain-containing protein [Bacteroidota bacterium]
MKFYTNSLLLCFVLFAGSLLAQTTVRGEVYDEETGETLIGANIIIEGTSQGTVTDFDGSFELKTDVALPFDIIVSYTGFSSQTINITTADEKITARLGTDALTIETVEVKGQRISDKQQQAPLTIEALDNIAIKETASESFYDGLGTLKGVDLTAASLGFKVINMRGFNSTSPVRSLQIIDGLDNQAPGLNFSLGNFLGSSELDVNRVELIVGASSAFYGPNAFNGVISMETKDPFFHKGLSAMVKAGERNLLETAVRWGDAIKNKDGLDFLAYKFNFSYLRADDWVADNYDPVDESRVDASNPGRFDAVNIYGDEYQSGNDFSSFPRWEFPGLGTWYRTGYREEDLVDYDTRNLKLSGAVHLRTNPAKGLESPELIFSTSYGTGTTVYQGDNRFSLRGITFSQQRLEFRKRNKFFLRAYTTRTGAGDSYDPYFTALELLERAKDDREWSQDYAEYWLDNIKPQIDESDYPELVVLGLDPVTFEVQTEFDVKAADQWLIDNQDLLVQWHSEAAGFANQQSQGSTSSVDFFQPGTDRFNQEFDDIRNTLRTEGGTQFFDNSALYHVHGEHIFTPKWTDKITVGANYRLYTPESRGTVFSDTSGTKITNSEVGLYWGIEKAFFDKKLRAQMTVRADKNQNFDWLSSQAASLVWNPSASNYLRVSFSSAIRNPTLSDQYLLLDVGRATLAGNLDGVQDLITTESLQEYFNAPRPGVLQFFDIDPVRPEQVSTIEAGYRTTLFNSTYIDAGYYFSVYEDFLGFNIGVRGTFEQSTGLPINLDAFRFAANSINEVTTQGVAIGINHYFANYYMISGNYSWNKLLKTAEDDPIIPAFNTPEHKFNLGLSGRDLDVVMGGMKIRNVGFKINYKWIEGFIFEGSPQFTGFIPTYDLLDAQVNFRLEKINTTMKIGASNILNNLSFQTYGGPRIGRLAYISFVYSQDKK